MYLSSSEPRQQALFDFDWLFHLGEMSPEAALAGDHDWQPVSLPHDWFDTRSQPCYIPLTHDAFVIVCERFDG